MVHTKAKAQASRSTILAIAQFYFYVRRANLGSRVHHSFGSSILLGGRSRSRIFYRGFGCCLIFQIEAMQTAVRPTSAAA